MEYKDDERPSLNSHGTGQLESLQHAAVPATLLPIILSHLGLGDRPMAEDDQAVRALRDEKSHVRVAAVRSLGERREVSSLPFLVSALHDPAWEVRAAAVWALSAFGRQAPVEALIEALDDEDGSVRAAALRVLSGVRGQVPQEPLARMLHDADWQVREAAALTVEELEEIEVLDDRYQLQDPIGKGGMATIYRGRDLHMNRVVAVKVLQEAYNTNPKFVRRFEREAKAASALQHPNIVQVYDYGQADGNYYIVMELVEGTDLRRYLSSRGVLDVDRAIIIAQDVALGLGAAHRRGIVHRDVKPQNILVSRDGSIKLTDFGIVSVYQGINPERLTTTGMTLGTVQYYSPEQAQGEIVSPAADVYGVGIVMYEMLTGRPPFDGDSPVAVAWQHVQDAPIPPSQFNPAIPAALEEIILRCLEKVPEMRFRDGSQLARALEMLGDANAPPPGSAASYQFQRRTAPRSGAVQPGQQNSRFATIVTGLIILSTLILLGFSVYLAAVQLHLFPIPFINGGSAPTPTIITAIVPNLVGDDYLTAKTEAEKAGFKLQLANGQTSSDGVVTKQAPAAGVSYAKGSTIEITMAPKQVKVPAIRMLFSVKRVETQAAKG
jgi:serine/threonine protein kinase